jgi:hypothetical protein
MNGNNLTSLSSASESKKSAIYLVCENLNCLSRMRKARLKTKLNVNKNSIIKKSKTLIPTLGTHLYLLSCVTLPNIKEKLIYLKFVFSLLEA